MEKVSDKELHKKLSVLREKLRLFRFENAFGKAKNLKAGKNMRREIAQILTELNTRAVQ
ncbi:50S ribosomal protein L29 [Candidatus Wolfebacteria bacterium]|nr:MAG: 50S ribosomal protein L29 [Candidatus Wolfebacteria bacterium]